MPTEAKRAVVAELTEAFSASRASIVTDYRGLTVSDISAVRRSLRERGVSYRVVKNRLAKIAAAQAGVDELATLLDGPSAVALTSEDETALAKAFLEAIRPFKTVTVRGAVVSGRRIEASEIQKLADLPSREVLLAQLAGAFAAPMAAVAGLLEAPMRDTAGLIAALADARGAEAA